MKIVEEAGIIPWLLLLKAIETQDRKPKYWKSRNYQMSPYCKRCKRWHYWFAPCGS